MLLSNRVVRFLPFPYLILMVFFVCSGCTKKAVIPSPPPGYSVNSRFIPKSISDCPWDEVEQKITVAQTPPSAFIVNCLLLKALDPTIRPENKLNLISGKIDKSLFKQINILQEQYPFLKFFARDPIRKNAKGKYEIDINIDLMGHMIPIPVELDYDHGRWKLSKNFTCGVIGLINYDNPRQARASQIRCFS